MSDASFTRFVLDGKVEHREGQQLIGGRGLAGDQFKNVHRIEPHGFASYPVQGGIGALIQSRGSRDSGYVFGGENPNLRPKGDMLTQGGTAIYDAAGNIVSIVGAKLRIVHSAVIHLIAPEIILEGLVKLGGPDASMPASKKGTVDTGGFADDTNLATRVLVK